MPKIQDYSLIGNARSAALISCEGSIDWLCWPRFDSPALFANLLDTENGGGWKIAPIGPKLIKRRYIPDTNVLETEFHASSGIVLLTDFMPVADSQTKKNVLLPENEVVRRVESLSGQLEMEMVFEPRPEYAQSRVRLEKKDFLGIRLQGKDLFTLRSNLEMVCREKEAYARWLMKEGDVYSFSLTCHSKGPAVLTPIGNEYQEKKLEQTVRWWKGWAQKIQYKGVYRDLVMRSALTLKLLSFSPTGTFVAAPTTSLPEQVGGKLNWDYRYCWLRDASFISRALFGLGCHEEANVFVNWLLYSTRLSRYKMHILFDVYGRYCGGEKELKQFKGYKNSRPVRIRNAAADQFQLDVYGELVEAITNFIKKEKRKFNYATRRELIRFGKIICKYWEKPDHGIWESREEVKNHTYSLLMCWLALSNLLDIHEEIKLKEKHKIYFLKTQKAVQKTIEEKGWNRDIGSYTEFLNGTDVGASLLYLSIHGFESFKSERMQKTFLRIQKRLQAGPDLFYRNELSKKREEGAFNICNFWVVEFLAMGGGTLNNAKEIFEKGISYLNNVGLLAEETHPETKDALGNFPLGLAHAGLINAALSITEREKRDKT